MAIVVLVLWMFTAGAGFYLLVTSSLGRARPAGPAGPGPQSAPVGPPARRPPPAPEPPLPAAAARPRLRRYGGASRRRAALAPRGTPGGPGPVGPALAGRGQAGADRARRPVAGGVRPSGLGHHRAGVLAGLHAGPHRALGWIAFGLVAATACVGLAWFTANIRAARGPIPAARAVLRRPPRRAARQRRGPHRRAGRAHRPGPPRLAGTPGQAGGQCRGACTDRGDE